MSKARLFYEEHPELKGKDDIPLFYGEEKVVSNINALIKRRKKISSYIRKFRMVHLQSRM
jgi:hypothetical protein